MYCVVCSVPQGLVLGPLLFLMYTAELDELASRLGVTLHAPADDNQLYLSCRTDDASIGVFTIGPLGPCPPLDSENFFHTAKNATLEKFDCQENS